MAKLADTKFNRYEYRKKHQVSVSSLVCHGINVSCVDDFPLEYMHLGCLGVTKKWLSCIIYGNHMVASLSRDKKNIVSYRLENINVPKEFARRPRGLHDFVRFKATEFRQIMLYTGPVVFRDILPREQYDHFLKLTVGMSILLDEDATFREEKIDIAQENLLRYVKDAEQIFGPTFMSYNIHSLMHIAADVIHFGVSLNDLSAFPFENLIYRLKKMVRNGQNPIAQVTKKLLALENANLYQKPVMTKLQIGGRKSDSYFLLENHVAIVTSVIDKEYECQLYNKGVLYDFFKKPIKSSEIDIFYLTHGAPYKTKLLSRSALKRKMIGIPWGDDRTVLFKLRHL